MEGTLPKGNAVMQEDAPTSTDLEVIWSADA